MLYLEMSKNLAPGVYVISQQKKIFNLEQTDKWGKKCVHFRKHIKLLKTKNRFLKIIWNERINNLN